MNSLQVHPCLFQWLSFLPLYGLVIFCCIYAPHLFFINSSDDGHLGCFHVLAIANSAAVNIGVHVFLLTLVFSGYMPNSGISGSIIQSEVSQRKTNVIY